MNLKYHIAVAAFGFLITDDPLFFIGAIFPDLSLLFNEIKIRYEKEKFDSMKVSNFEFILYHFVHSLWMSAICFSISPLLGLGHVFHIVPDWFTHTGRFSGRPFYPFHYGIKFGREWLK